MSTSTIRQNPSQNDPVGRCPGSQRGIAMLAAIGFLAAIGVGAAISFHMVSGENNVQHQLLKEKVAFYAAEAGLAESRAIIRSLWTLESGFNQVFSDLTGASPGTTALNQTQAAFGVPGPCNTSTGGSKATPCLYPLLPSTPYPLRVSEDEAFPGQTADDSEYYPEQANVSFRSFFYDDEDDGNFTVDSNRQFWVVSVGEVRTGDGRPIRAIVRALVTGPMPSESSVGYSGQKGGDSSKRNSTY